MARSRLPLVYDNRLFLPDEEKDQLLPVIVGSESWYSWLANERNNPLEAASAFMSKWEPLTKSCWLKEFCG